MLFLLMLVIALILQFFLPWWIIAIVAFALSAWKAVTGAHAFIHSFTAIFTLWIAAGLVQTLPNENILANRVGEMLKLPFTEFNWIIVLLATGIIGGLVAGFSGLSGFYFRSLIRK